VQRDRPPVIRSISSYQEQSLATPRTQKQTLIPGASLIS